MSPPSRIQQEAQQQARELYREVEEYRKILPPNQRVNHNTNVCRADGWTVSRQYLDGDFDLDEALARQLLENVIAGAPQLRQPPAASVHPSASVESDLSWIEEYIKGETPGAIGSRERFSSEMKNAAIGAGNILANANAGKQAANEVFKSSTAGKLDAAARAVESGTARSVKLNQHVTIYNANRSGKGRPRPRIRISGMPMKIISPSLGSSVRVRARSVNAPMEAVKALQAKKKLGQMMGDTHWTGKAAFLNGRAGGGILTFGPSAALDAYNSIQRDLEGNIVGFDYREFLIASAKSQCGNVAGMMTGALVTVAAPAIALAIGFTLTSAAPVMLIALGTGAVVQALWGTFGGADWAENAARESFGG